MSGFEGMVGLRPAMTPAEQPQAGSLAELAGATFDETLATNPSTAYYREKYLEAAYALSPDVVDATSARQRVKDAGLEGKLQIPDQGIPRFALDTLIDRKQQEAKREAVLARAPSGIEAGGLRLAVSFGASLLDPLNVAAGFFPVVGEARYAQLLARAPLGILGRSAVRAGVGAAEGAAGTAVLEPIIAASKRADQEDYTMADSLANIAFGGVFGAGLHVMGGALKEGYQALRGSAAALVEGAAPETRAAALKTAVAQAASGEPVNVEPLFDLDPAAREAGAPERPGTENAPAEGATVIDRQSLTAGFTGDAGEFDVARAGDAVRAQVGAALDTGQPVAFVIEGKRIPVASVSEGQMRDTQGAPLGLMPVLQPAPGDHARIEIGAPPSAPDAPQRIDLSPVREAAAAPKLSTVADESSAAQGERALKAQRPEEDAQRIEQDTQEELLRLKEAGIEHEEELAPYHAAVSDAETYARAARAAVLCGMRHA